MTTTFDALLLHLLIAASAAAAAVMCFGHILQKFGNWKKKLFKKYLLEEKLVTSYEGFSL